MVDYTDFYLQVIVPGLIPRLPNTTTVIGNATLDATGVLIPRTLIIPNKSGTLATTDDVATGITGISLAAVATSGLYSDLIGSPGVASTSVNGLMSAADKTKLNSVASGATANSADAVLLSRANHTGTQAISTVTGLQTALDAKAPIDSPTFTGTPAAPTQVLSDSTTKIATTSFVKQNITNLNLGTMSTQNSGSVAITGGTISGLSSLAASQASFSSVSTQNYVDFTPLSVAPSHSHGRVYYLETEDALSYQPSTSAASMQIGYEMWVRSKNTTLNPILNGQCVYISGASTNGVGLPDIGLARANNLTTATMLGLATEDIAVGSVGMITIIGKVNDLNTSAWNAGDTLYLSETVAGTLTTTRPTAPNYAVPVARVINKHGTTGSLLVLPSTPSIGFGLSGQIRGMNSSGTAEEFKQTTGTGNVVALQNSPKFNGLILSINQQSSNYTLTVNDYAVLGNTSLGNITFTLPDAFAAGSGRLYRIKKTDSSINTLTLVPQAGQLIDGEATYVMDKKTAPISILSDGTGWYIV